MTPRQFFGFALEYNMYKEAANGEEDVDKPNNNSNSSVYIDQLWG